MRFRIVLPENGAQLVGDVSVPGIRIGQGLRPRPEAAGKAVAEALIPSIAAQIEPQLPRAAPARRNVQRDSDGKVVGTIEIPPTPPPTIRARQVAQQLASAMAAQYATAIRAEYASLDAAQATAKAQATANAQVRAATDARLARQVERAAKSVAEELEIRRKVETAAKKAAKAMGGRSSVHFPEHRGGNPG
jgi:hypothetical protein